MRYINTKQLIVIFLWFSILTACGPTFTEPPISIDNLPVAQTPTPPTLWAPSAGCIPPLETFAYTTRIDETKPRPGMDLIITPTSPWQVETKVPLPSNQGNVRRDAVQVHLIDGHTEIWTKIVFYGEHPLYDEGFMIYRPDTKTWREVPVQIGDQNEVYVGKLFLFLAKDGSLWGMNFWGAQPDSLKAYPLLSKYNEKTEKFDFDLNTQGIPAGQYDNRTFLASIILLGPDGLFWFLVPKHAIYSYNPLTKEVKRHAEIPDHHVQYATIAPDGKIYFVIVTSPSQKGLFYFDPKTGEVKGIDLTYSVYDSYLPNPFADHLGRLWLGGLGWREPDQKTWYRLHPSPIFITKAAEGPSTYWQNPFIFLESSDERLWFRSDNGMAWLDLQKEEWCWFTTYQSNIVEDQQNNLWMIADGKLYQYPLKP